MSEFNVTIKDYEGEVSLDIKLPFVPYPGLNIESPINGDYMRIDEVYWDSKKGRFEVYLAAEHVGVGQ